MSRVNEGVVSGPRLEEVVVIALAAGRVARAISVDQVTQPTRDRIDRWASMAAPSRRRRARQTVSELIHCPVCVGWWTSLATSAMWPGRMRLRRGLAVAGVQVLMTLGERLVSESGRAAIHDADRAETHNPVDQ